MTETPGPLEALARILDAAAVPYAIIARAHEWAVGELRRALRSAG